MVRLAGSFINHKFSLDNYHLQLYSYCPFGHTLAKSAVFRRGNQERNQLGNRWFRTQGDGEVFVTAGVFFNGCSVEGNYGAML
jgi:hypothetical protein